jgi:hypothetical protein
MQKDFIVVFLSLFAALCQTDTCGAVLRLRFAFGLCYALTSRQKFRNLMHAKPLA